jgi:glycerol-3-phosphate acyltransferase PlsX
MSDDITLSVDAMGGDHAPEVPVEGMALLLARRPQTRFIVHGDEGRLAPLLASKPGLSAAVRVQHTMGQVAMDEKPAQALRRGKGSSMWNAVASVAEGHAQAAVSAGNTGALMAISMLVLRKMEGVHRPAMTALWPTARGRTVVLDVGANLEADAEQLVTYAIMGEAYARAVERLERPSVGLLNIGTEDVKGPDEVREAHGRLKALAERSGMDYRGFVEGNDISMGAVDVVVTDGFTGNVALKTAEGTARLVTQILRQSLTANPLAKAGALLARGGLMQLKERMNPSNVNGGVLLGLNGLVVKSHGGADATGFSMAMQLASRLARSAYREEIAATLAQIAASVPVSEASEPGQVA